MKKFSSILAKALVLWFRGFSDLKINNLYLHCTFIFQVSLFLNGSMYGMDDVLICQDTWAGTSKVVYTAVSQLAQFFVPVIIVICLYLSIYLKLKNRPQVSKKCIKP